MERVAGAPVPMRDERGTSRAGEPGELDPGLAVAAAQRGDTDAFRVLYRDVQPRLLRYLRALVGEDAEDVASETWLQVARDLPRFAGDPIAFRVWLFRIARHRAIDDRRRAWRRREESRDHVETGRPAPDAAAEVIEHAGTEWALRLIGELPPDQAEAVLLRVVAGLDVAGTAEVLGKRPGAVRIAAMRGLRRLAVHPQVRSRRVVVGADLTHPHLEGA
jgi:RNA polymerase sigma-70 factor (ECF subfamily)